MSYVFYDTETTGTETAFDQILQFAAVKTDDNFNEIASVNIRCRIQPYIIPSPCALRVTGVRPEMLTNAKLPSHYEAVKQIRAKLVEWSPAIFVGYNSIAFDEDLLRQALFQTLHPAYLTNTKGNARADVMRIANAVSTYAPEAIKVPIDTKGKQTFRLELLAPANGFQHDNAHDALGDVNATIYIARLLKARAPDVWEAMNCSARKSGALEYIQSFPVLSLTERSFGRNYSWLVSACGLNPNNSGQVAVFDLAFNPDEFSDLPVEKLIEVLNAKTKVIRTVRANAQPIIMPATAAPSSTKALTIPSVELRRRAAAIASNVEFQARVGEALAKRFADKEPATYVEQRIYDGFPSDEDQVVMEKFHTIPWAERPDLIGQIRDERIVEFSRRLIYTDQPIVLAKADADAFHTWASERVMTTEDVPWMTVPKASAEIDGLFESADGQERNALSEMRTYLDEVTRKYS